MTITESLKKIRRERKLKQEDIAKILNTTQQQYQLYESGIREIPLHHFITLARYYNITLDELAGI